MALIFVTTSMRLGEVLAMTWNNMNWETGEYYVCQMITSNRFKPKLKKGADFYYVKLEDAVIERLKIMKQIAETEGVVSDWIFPSLVKDLDNYKDCPYRGRPISKTTLAVHLKQDQKNAGLKPINVHGLRITSATLEYIRSQGTPLAWDRVKQKLNHKNIRATEGYIQIAKADLEKMDENKGSLINFCIDGAVLNKVPSLPSITTEADLLDRQIAIEEKKLRLLELRKKNEILESQGVFLQAHA